MARRPLAVLLLCTLSCPAPGWAWGFEVHRFITARALDVLPGDLRPFFDRQRGFVVEHSIDPDLWRLAGFVEEPPRHFLDLDAYGDFPFVALPRDYEAAVRRHGLATVQKRGTLPWRAAEVHAQLVKAFEQVRDGTSPYARDNAAFYAAALAHYTADAHVPLHAVLNYDGQLTGQHGVHGRYETELFLRYRDHLDIDPRPMPPVDAPRDFVFDTLRASFRVAGPVLEADREALGPGVDYDDAYFDRFFARARPLLEPQLETAIAAVAAMIAGAWEQAGRPAVPPATSRPVRKKRATD